jgi:hypothetical protein
MKTFHLFNASNDAVANALKLDRRFGEFLYHFEDTKGDPYSLRAVWQTESLDKVASIVCKGAAPASDTSVGLTSVKFQTAGPFTIVPFEVANLREVLPNVVQLDDWRFTAASEIDWMKQVVWNRIDELKDEFQRAEAVLSFYDSIRQLLINGSGWRLLLLSRSLICLLSDKPAKARSDFKLVLRRWRRLGIVPVQIDATLLGSKTIDPSIEKRLVCLSKAVRVARS